MRELHFPVGGLEKKLAYRQQYTTRPYTTPDCQNVRPTETLEGRERGGSRPGLGKLFSTELGGGEPVQMLNSITAVQDDGYRYWIDIASEDSLNEQWEQASWIGYSPGLFPLDIADLTYSPDKGGLIRKAIANFDDTQPYTIEIEIAPWEEEHHGEYRLYAKMDDVAASPSPLQDGVVAALKLSDRDGSNDGTTGIFSGSLKTYEEGALTNTYNFDVTESPIGDSGGGTFSLLIDNDEITVSWRGHILIDEQDVSLDIGASAGNRVGFGMDTDDGDDGGICLVESFMIRYYEEDVHEKYRSQLVAVSSGRLYYENEVEGTMEETDVDNPDLNATEPLQSVEFQQDLYIADYSNLALVVATGASLNAAGTALSDTEISAAVAAAITADKASLVVFVYDPQDAAVAGCYKISAAESGLITLSSSATDGVSTGTCSFRVEKAPKIYSPLTDALEIWEADSGIVPPGCSLIARVFGCLMLAGDRLDPHQWYLSRQGDPLDFDYGADPDDPGRAVAGNNCEAGKLGEPITCLAPQNDDYCIMGGTNSLHVMRGHPLYSGAIDRLSDITGVVSGTSWSYGPEGEIVFLTRDGVYVMGAGVEAYPVRFSRERLPQELIGVDPELYVVTMSYDVYGCGFHLYITPKDAKGDEAQKHWWLDWNLKSFWPVALQSDHEPYSCYRYHTSRLTGSRVLLGGRDGYIRSYISSNRFDDGHAIASYIVYGPIPLGKDIGGEGIIDSLIGVLDNKSALVRWQIHVGDTHEEALNSTLRTYGTWLKGSNHLVRPRAKGKSFCIKLLCWDRWALEGIGADWHVTGRQR